MCYLDLIFHILAVFPLLSLQSKLKGDMEYYELQLISVGLLFQHTISPILEVKAPALLEIRISLAVSICVKLQKTPVIIMYFPLHNEQHITCGRQNYYSKKLLTTYMYVNIGLM